MQPVMTKAEARAWRERWRRVNEFTVYEARAATVRERMHDLEVLFASAGIFPTPDDGSGVEEVRRRWARLRDQHLAR